MVETNFEELVEEARDKEREERNRALAEAGYRSSPASGAAVERTTTRGLRPRAVRTARLVLGGLVAAALIVTFGAAARAGEPLELERPLETVYRPDGGELPCAEVPQPWRVLTPCPVGPYPVLYHLA